MRAGGVIYLGEVAGLLVLATSKSIASDAAGSSTAWLFANVAQALWCASFRRWALDRLWLSTLCLGATAACLQISQRMLVGDLSRVRALGNLSSWSAALVIMPRSLHAGWVTAATLVNANAYAGRASLGAVSAFAVCALSQCMAVSVADFYARSGIPSAALAIGWALFAVSRGTPVGPDAAALGPVALDGLATTALIGCAMALASVVASLAAWSGLGGPDYAIYMRIPPRV
jgi:hypothetical protein